MQLKIYELFVQFAQFFGLVIDNVNKIFYYTEYKVRKK